MDELKFRDVMGHLPTGVTVITTKDRRGQPFGLTANAVTSVSLAPPLILICVDQAAQCYPCFDQSRAFVVNFLSEAQEEISRRFATKAANKFDGVMWRSGGLGIPLLDATLGHLECEVIQKFYGGDHAIYLGRVVDGCGEAGQPLLFFGGKYRRLN